MTEYERKDFIVEVYDFEANGTSKFYHRTEKPVSSKISTVFDQIWYVILYHFKNYMEVYNFNAIYVVANKAPTPKSIPLIVHIHDGPYEMSTTGFNPIFVTLVDLGFAVLSVNYRGSIGNSDLVLQSILGNIDQVSEEIQLLASLIWK